MPRNASDVYDIPAGTKGVPETVIRSEPYNAFLDDLVATLNADYTRVTDIVKFRSVEHYDVLLGSAANQTATMQAAITGAADEGVILYVPGGAGIICDTRSLDIPDSFAMLGGAGGGHFKRGVWLQENALPGVSLATLEELPFFLIKNRRNVRIENISVEIDVAGTDVRQIVCAGGEGVSAPISYPNPNAWDIRVFVNQTEMYAQHVAKTDTGSRKIISAIALGATTTLTMPGPSRYLAGQLFLIDGVTSTVQLNGKVCRAGAVAGDTVVALNPDGTNIDSSAYTAFVATPGNVDQNYAIDMLSYVDSAAGHIWLTATINLPEPDPGDVITLSPQVRRGHHSAFYVENSENVTLKGCEALGLWYVSSYGIDNVRLTRDGCNFESWDNRAVLDINSSIDNITTRCNLNGRYLNTATQAITSISGEPYKTVTGVTAANPPVFTSVAHGIANGTKFVVRSVSRMGEANNRVFTSGGATADTLQAVGIDGSKWQPYGGGGRIYTNLLAILTVGNTYPATISFDISGGPIPYVDGESITPYEVGGQLDRFGQQTFFNTQFILEDVNQAAGTAKIRDFDARELSPYLGGAYAQSNRAYVDLVAHGKANGRQVIIEDVTGLSRLNGNSFEVAHATANQFTLIELGSRSYVDLIDAGTWTNGTGGLRDSIDVATYGVSTGASIDGLQKGNLVEGNAISHVLDRMIVQQGPCDGMRIVNNTMRHGRAAGIILDASIYARDAAPAIVQGNTIFNVPTAIFISKTDRVQVLGNTVRYANVAVRADQSNSVILDGLQALAPDITASRLVQLTQCDHWDINLKGRRGVFAVETVDCKNTRVKGEVIGPAQGVYWSNSSWAKIRTSARVRVIVDVNLAAPGANLDGLAMVAGEEALLDGQTIAADKGKYVWNGAAVPMTRSPDMDTWAEIPTSIVQVTAGTYAGRIWKAGGSPPLLAGILGVDPVTFYEMAAIDEVENNHASLNIVNPTVRHVLCANYSTTNRFDGEMTGGPLAITDNSLFTDRNDFSRSRRNGVETAFSTLTVSPSANQNNYDPWGITAQWVKGGDATLRLTPSAPVAINGLIGPRRVTIDNSASEFPVVLTDQSSLATAANRWSLARGLRRGHAVIWPGDVVTAEYDEVTQRRRIVATSDRTLMSGLRRAFCVPNTGGTAATAMVASGFGLSVAGTFTNPATAATTPYRSMMRRTVIATGAVAGTQAEIRSGHSALNRGGTAGLGGIQAHFIFGGESIPSSADSPFFGLSNLSLGNADASTLLNCVGFGKDPGETTLRVQSNDGAGAAARVDTGLAWATDVVYEGFIWSAPNGTGLTTILWRLDDTTIAPDIRYLTADIPANNTGLFHSAHTSNRAAAVDYQIAVMLFEQWMQN